MNKRHHAWSFGVLALSGCMAQVGDVPESSDEELDVGSTSQAVQTDYRQTRHLNVATNPSDDLAVTGAAFIPLRDAAGAVRTNSGGAPLRGSCGVTFVSPRYAITAAHCVDGGSLPNPATDTFYVEQYDISALSWDKINAASAVTGGFPNYTRPQFTAADGYKVTRYNQCKVVRRCGDWGPQLGCNMNADVALIRCADRSRYAPYIAVADAESAYRAVEMPWFHEYVDMTMDSPGPAPTVRPPEDPTFFERWFAWAKLKDRYDHYTVYNGESSADQNYHYTEQQLLPLRSRPWVNGDLWTARTRTGDDSPNLIADGDFEAQPSRTLGAPYWAEGTGQGVDIDLNYEFQGRKNGFIWARNGWNAMVQELNVTPNTDYVLTGWVRNSQNFGGGYFGVRNPATNAPFQEVNFGPLAKYTQLRVTFNSGTLTKVRVFAGYWGPGSDAWMQIDELRMHRRRAYDEEQSAVTWTDLFGCHGTSGSGVLQRNPSTNKLELLGPVARGSIEMSGRLCHDGSLLRIGGQHLAYTRPEYVRELVRTAFEDTEEWKWPSFTVSPGVFNRF